MSFTDFKEVALPTSGTSSKYGSQDLLDVMQILNGKTVSGRRPKVANQWLWQGAQDIAEIVAPASPVAGTQRFYIDAADHIPKMKDSSGVVTPFSAAGANVSINQSNTYGDFDQIFRSTRLKVRNPANTQSYSFVGSAITAARNITLPLLTADDQITTDAVATTLTNKTIDYNLNTITNLPSGGGSGNVSTTTSNTYGDFDQIFRSTRIKLTNPANTFNYSFVGSAITAARNVTLPLLTADDQITTDNFATTLTNKTIDTSANTLPKLRSSAIYTVFIDGTTVKARNNVTGAIDFSSSNSTDASTTINSAINNIKNITGAALSSGYAARVHLAAGVYNCTTAITVSDAGGNANREGVQIVGEGMGTTLSFAPGSAMTNAITFSSNSFAVLQDIRIAANSNVVNYILLISGATGVTDWLGSRGKIDRVLFEGATWGSTYVPVTGSVGIFQDGGTGTPTAFFWRITNCDFQSMDTGIKTTGLYGTSTLQHNNTFLYCNTGVDIAGAQHIVTNMWHQGTSGGGGVGTTAVRLRGTALHNIIDNLNCEMQLDPGTTPPNSGPCQAILLDSGAYRNYCTNIHNDTADVTAVGTNLPNKFVITDNSGQPNYFTYLDDGHATGKFQTKTADGSFISWTSGKVGVSGSNAFDVMPTATNDFAFFRLVPTITTVASSAARAVFRFLNNNPTTPNTEEYIQLSALGTLGYWLYPTHGSSGGSLRPLVIGMDGVASITVNTDGNLDTNGRTVTDSTQSPVVKRTGMWIPAAGTTLTTASQTEGMLVQHVITGTGTVSNTFDTTEGILVNIASGATAGNAAGLVSPTAGVGVARRLFAGRIVTRVKIDSTTTSKLLFGLTSATTLPTAAATQPLATTDHGIIVGFVETGTGSTNWTIWHNDGATSVTADNVTGPIAKDANFHTIEINWTASGNINVIFDGVSQVVSTDLPATTANLFFNLVAVNTSTTARTLSTKGCWIEATK